MQKEKPEENVVFTVSMSRELLMRIEKSRVLLFFDKETGRAENRSGAIRKIVEEYLDGKGV